MTDTKPHHDEEPKPFYDPVLFDDALTDIAALAHSIGTAPSAHHWFQNTLVGLVRTTVENGRELARGRRESITLTAWACRNLLELSICTRFILLSQEQAKQFVDDVWIDAAEMFAAFGSWLEANGRSAASIQPFLQSFAEGKHQLGDQRSRYLQLKDMAETVGLSSEYKAMNKATSKLVHQTAYAVLLPRDPQGRGIATLMFDQGVRYCLDAYGRIKRHVDAHGADWPSL